MKFLSYNFREIRSTLALALPIAAGNLSGMLMGWVDALMVGHLGVIPLAAVAFALPIWMFFYFLGSGCILSVSVRAAEAHGGRDIPALAKWLSASLLIVLMMGIFTTAVALVFVKFLGFFGQQPEVSQACVGFYICIVLSLTPSLLWLSLKTFLDSLGKPWIGFWSLICSVGVNILLNWLLIFGNCGFPQLGITGAGLATLLARIFGASMMIAVFLITPHLRALLLTTWKWNSEAIRDLIRLGVPITSQMLSENIAFNLGTIMIGWLGAVPLAAHQIAFTMAGTTFMLPLGVGTALTIRMGNLLGAGENKRLPEIAYGTILTTCVFMGCIGGAVILFSGQIPKWFVDSSAVHSIAKSLLIIMGILQITDALYILAQCALRGLSDVRFPAFINIFAYLGFGVTCAFVLGFLANFQAPGVWIGLFLGTALSGALCFLRLRKKITQASLANY